MDEAILRLKLAADAGADVCFIEGVKSQKLLQTTVESLAPKPVRITFEALSIYTSLMQLQGSCQRYFRRPDAVIYMPRNRTYGCQNDQYV
jgi:hypothetical protein